MHCTTQNPAVQTAAQPGAISVWLLYCVSLASIAKRRRKPLPAPILVSEDPHDEENLRSLAITIGLSAAF
jgi:hypothetical protein